MIQFTNVTRKYRQTVAVSDLSFTVERGSFCALLGPNGAGKTTCLKMILDFIAPSQGWVTVDGLPSGSPRARASLGYLSENIRIPPHLSARGLLRRAAQLCGLRSGEAQRRIDELLELVGMRSKAAAPSKTYSKGMLQRTGLAAALVHAPRLLLLDEPITGLDPVGIRDFRMVLERLRGSDTTVLLSSHILSEAEKVCDTVIMLDNGTCVLRDSMAAITDAGATLEDVFMNKVSRGAER